MTTPDLTQDGRVLATTDLPWMLQLVLQWYAARQLVVTSWTLSGVQTAPGQWTLAFAPSAKPLQNQSPGSGS